MPLEVTVDERKRVVTIRGWGDVNDRDLEAACAHCRSDPKVDPKFTRMCDLTAVTGAEISDEALEKWAADPIANPAVRHAVICINPGAVQLAMEFAARSRRYFREVSVFPSPSEAAVWMAESRA